jgi:beta-lactamase superfamily II metal-dependent hydrolase
MLRISVLLALGFALPSCLPPVPEGTEGRGQARACGTGTWRPGWLEIHHIDAGVGVATLIVSPGGQSLLVDAGEAAWDSSRGAETVGATLRAVLGCAVLDYVLITHFHVDHVGFPGQGGLWHLVHQQGFSVGKLLHRDLYRFVGAGGATLTAWQAYLQSEVASALHPEIAVVGRAQIELSGVALAILAVDGGGAVLPGDFSAAPAPPDENDYSIALLLRMGRLDYFAAGDLSGETLRPAPGDYSYHDIETRIAARAKDVDVYRVSHHGSSHASNATLLAELAPRVSILPVGDGNGHGHPSQSTVDRLLARSALYLTQAGDPGTDLGAARVVGHVVLRTATGDDYFVNGDRFVASDPLRVDADGDGYFQEADPDDRTADVVPAAQGGCDDAYQACP